MERLTEEQKKERQKQNEEKKEYLLSYKEYKQQAKRLEEQLEEIRLGKMFPSLVQSDMPSAHNQKDFSDYMVRCDELIDEILKQRYKAIERFTEIQKQIELMENEKEKMILTYRYIRNYNWGKICEMMEYSWKQIHRIHDKALSNFEIKKDDIE